MYVQHFSLKGRPFAASRDHEFFIPNDEVDATVKRIRDVLLGQGAVAVISGGPGVGKSALVDAARAGVADQTAVAWADLRQSEPESFFDQLLVSLGADPADGSGPLATQCLRQLVREQHAAGRQVTAVVDASNVTAERAKRLLRLAHLMSEADVPLNLILMGPHTLHKVLDVPGLIHLRQRVCLRHRVRPFSESETQTYIAEALHAVGGDSAELLSEEVPGVVFRYVAGVPRLVNTLMDAALIEAALQESSQVTKELLQQVAHSLGWRTLGGGAKRKQPAPEKAKSRPLAFPKKSSSPLELAAESNKTPAAPTGKEATSPPSEITASLSEPIDFEKTDVADKAEAERKKQNHPDAATAGVPAMDAADTSATGMLRLEDLDERFAESVFGND